MRFNREFDSNEIDESDLQSEKHDDPRISISEQIVIRDADEDLGRSIDTRAPSTRAEGQAIFCGLGLAAAASAVPPAHDQILIWEVRHIANLRRMT
jgi:hypothetical protein